MRTLKLTLAYNGTQYAGWQVQAPGRTTVQEVLERAIAAVTGETVRAMASGRTDAGVHALGQVASFRTQSALPAEVFVRALNAHLPDDVAVLDARDVPDDFHATLSADKKRYRYLIHNHPIRDPFFHCRAWHYPAHLEDGAMHRAAQSLLGRHDFKSFETSGSERQTSVRTIFDILVRRDAADARLVVLEVEADGFLYNMVRSIVGTLVQVGRGAREESWVAEVLAACDRRKAGKTAPPQGLYLVRVDY